MQWLHLYSTLRIILIPYVFIMTDFQVTWSCLKLIATGVPIHQNEFNIQLNQRYKLKTGVATD